MEDTAQTTRNRALTVTDNDALYRQLVSGDKLARNKMIEGNTGLVVFRVDTYLRTSPQMTYYREDMISEGLLGLCKAVDDMRSRGLVRHPKPTGYMTKIIDQHIARAVDERDTIVVPHATQKLARAKDVPIDVPKVVSDRALLGRPASTPFSTGAVMEVQEELLASCKDDLDKKIISMRSDGYTHEEIAKACSMSTSGITYRIKALGKRLVERCPEYRQYVLRDAEDD